MRERELKLRMISSKLWGLLSLPMRERELKQALLMGLIQRGFVAPHAGA